MTLRFDQWMNHCLFDPKKGYYARQIKNVGTEGDFTTASELSHALGQATAQWIKEEWDHHGEQLPIIELGAGSGTLSKQVRGALGWKRRLRLKHGIVEVSESLKKKQRQHLGKTVKWFSSVQEAVEAFHGKAILFSNEFVDAFPVRIFKKSHTHKLWEELYLTIASGQVREEWHPLTDLPESTLFNEPWTAGQRVEVHESYHTHLKEEYRSLNLGSILTVDYGDLLSQLYYRRPHGSIRAYFMHERLEGPLIYQNMGRQDLTADVNFTDLMNWSQKLGWKNLPLRTQAEFLKPFLSEEDQLVNPLGAGTAFKILIQRKERPTL